MQNEQFSRSAMLIGWEAIERLQSSRVAIFGLGGVGGAAAEALARSGIGAFTLVDHDKVALSNLNRQLIADHGTVGRSKAELTARRVLAINPAARVDIHEAFYLPGCREDLLAGADYCVDAIDTVTAKIGLVTECAARGIPIISAMGAGNRLDPAMLRVGDLFETAGCPLCRVMRRELRSRGVESLRVVYSKEQPKQFSDQCSVVSGRGTDEECGTNVPSSISFVPPVAGLLLAREVVLAVIQ